MLTQTMDGAEGAGDSCGAAIALLMFGAKPFLETNQVAPEGR